LMHQAKMVHSGHAEEAPDAVQVFQGLGRSRKD
jgi:hypothetical protein